MGKKVTQEDFINRAIEKHNGKYTYEKSILVNMSTKVIITCLKHGDFEQTPHAHLKGQGCKECGLITVKSKLSRTKENTIKQLQKVHGNRFDYSLNDVIENSHDTIKIRCIEHDCIFEQKVYIHLNGQVGCKECTKLLMSNLNLNDENDVINSFKLVHGVKYDYSLMNYTGIRNNIDIICKEHGIFQQQPSNHRNGFGCRKCSNQGTSNVESILKKSLPYNFIENDRSILDGKEIDLLYGNIGIEVNGVYWHSDEYKDKNYHLNKTKLAESKGIQLLHFWDFEIVEKLNLVVSMIKSKLHKSENKIYARKCTIKEVDFTSAKEFLTNNHLQGSGAVGSIRYGLYCDNILVSLMTFDTPRFSKKYDYELIRFCNVLNTNVIGGASKLFKHFLKYSNGSIVSYANRRFSNGNLYKQLGFDYVNDSSPNYFYTKQGKVLTRYQCQKHKLKNFLKDFDAELSEYQNMQNNGYNKVFDCGNLIFVYNR